MQWNGMECAMGTIKQLFVAAVTLLSLTDSGCSNNQSATSKSRPTDSDPVKTVVGRATWYGPGLYGNKTANGEILEKGTLTAAHGQLPWEQGSKSPEKTRMKVSLSSSMTENRSKKALSST